MRSHVIVNLLDQVPQLLRHVYRVDAEIQILQQLSEAEQNDSHRLILLLVQAFCKHTLQNSTDRTKVMEQRRVDRSEISEQPSQYQIWEETMATTPVRSRADTYETGIRIKACTTLLTT